MLEALRIRWFSRFRWVKEGDLPTRFFFNHVRNRSRSPLIRRISRINGEEIVDEDRIREEFFGFFSSLLSSEDNGVPVDDFLRSRVVNQLILRGEE